MSSIIRSYARNRAKVNMKKLGFRRVCKSQSFKNYWRRYGNFQKEGETE